MTKASYDIVSACDRIGLSRAEAAALIGISPPVFDGLVRLDLMPKPRAIGRRRLWYRREVEKAFHDLPFAEDEPRLDQWD